MMEYLVGLGLVALLGGATFTGSVYYIDHLEEAQAHEMKAKEELLEYIVNNNPSKIRVVSVRPMDTKEVEGLEEKMPNYEAVKSDNDKVRIIYKNYLKQRASGETQPTNVITIDTKELDTIEKLGITPKEKKAYNEAVKIGDYETAYNIIQATKERNKNN